MITEDFLKKTRKKKVMGFNSFTKAMAEYISNTEHPNVAGLLLSVNISRNQIYGWKRHDIYKRHYQAYLLAVQYIEDSLLTTSVKHSKKHIAQNALKIATRLSKPEYEYEPAEINNTEQVEIKYENVSENKF